MNTIQNDTENEKISNKDVFKELFKLGLPFLILVLLYLFLAV